eukprot:CAMPEP_0170634464 /NCGR_PEP_ID=MMETSP0224-20130122/36620_1 /TAXON_ID=285029 /ORGANISM="Togula jolla, Strain CCCM 725" /LENGTH=131 /DNA_ID=CAMNT_0010963735 /DNA_START=132 /DNA_END=526 /DNA_ORIENTATION=-
MRAGTGPRAESQGLVRSDLEGVANRPGEADNSPGGELNAPTARAPYGPRRADWGVELSGPAARGGGNVRAGDDQGMGSPRDPPPMQQTAMAVAAPAAAGSSVARPLGAPEPPPPLGSGLPHGGEALPIASS